MGAFVGTCEEAFVGTVVRAFVGTIVGAIVGTFVGAFVGSSCHTALILHPYSILIHQQHMCAGKYGSLPSCMSSSISMNGSATSRTIAKQYMQEYGVHGLGVCF